MFKNVPRRLAQLSIAVLMTMAARASFPASVHLAWDPSPEADLQGYKLFYGTAPGVYTSQVDVGNVTDYVISGLSNCSRYYFAAKAYDLTGNLSEGYSNDVSGMVDPSVATVSPIAAERGQSLTVTVNGSSFDQGASLLFSDRINVYSTTYVSCTQLRATISISGDATLGLQNAWVVNPDGSYGYRAFAFEVLPATLPIVTAVSPAPGTRGVPVSVRPSVTFSERMNPLTIKTSTVMLLRPDGTVVPQAAGYPALDVSGKIATLAPATNLQYGTTYRLQILGGVLGVRDSQGSPMQTTLIYGLGFLTVEGLSNDAPAVAETTPGAGATGVATDVKPTVTFSKAIDPLTVSAASVQLLGTDGIPVPQIDSPQLDFSGRVATLSLASPLQYGAGYSLHVEGGANGVRDTDGLPLQESYTQSPGFTTPAGPDTEPPSVAFTDPAEGARDLPVDGLINIVFSEAMDPASITSATVRILDPMDEPVPQAEGSPAIGDTGRIVTIVPENHLRPATVYRVQVLGGADGARDSHGNAMAEDYAQMKGLETVFGSETAPVVVSVNPADTDVNVPRDVHLSVTFSEPMDPTSITVDAVRLVDSQAQPVPQAEGSPFLEASGTIVTLVPEQQLTPGAVYFLQVLGGDGGVVDEEGTAMNEDFLQNSGFTITLGDTEGPAVIWTDPEDGDRRVDRHVRPRIYVNEAVDPTSVTPLTIILVGEDDGVIEQEDDSPSLDDTGTILRITPKHELRGHSVYRIQVIGGPEGLRDVSGNPMLTTFVLENGFETR